MSQTGYKQRESLRLAQEFFAAKQSESHLWSLVVEVSYSPAAKRSPPSPPKFDEQY
jgi:hypothetical protein